MLSKIIWSRLKHELNTIRFCGHRGPVLSLETDDFGDDALRVNISDINVKPDVFHVESGLIGPVKNKEHPFLRTDPRAKHEAGGDLGYFLTNLGIQFVRAEPESHGGQFRLGMVQMIHWPHVLVGIARRRVAELSGGRIGSGVGGNSVDVTSTATQQGQGQPEGDPAEKPGVWDERSFHTPEFVGVSGQRQTQLSAVPGRLPRSSGRKMATK